jgi:hypothetical protein
MSVLGVATITQRRTRVGSKNSEFRRIDNLQVHVWVSHVKPSANVDLRCRDAICQSEGFTPGFSNTTGQPADQVQLLASLNQMIAVHNIYLVGTVKVLKVDWPRLVTPALLEKRLASLTEKPVDKASNKRRREHNLNRKAAQRRHALPPQEAVFRYCHFPDRVKHIDYDKIAKSKRLLPPKASPASGTNPKKNPIDL